MTDTKYISLPVCPENIKEIVLWLAEVAREDHNLFWTFENSIAQILHYSHGPYEQIRENLITECIRYRNHEAVSYNVLCENIFNYLNNLS